MAEQIIMVPLLRRNISPTNTPETMTNRGLACCSKVFLLAQAVLRAINPAAASGPQNQHTSRSDIISLTLSYSDIKLSLSEWK